MTHTEDAEEEGCAVRRLSPHIYVYLGGEREGESLQPLDQTNQVIRLRQLKCKNLFTKNVLKILHEGQDGNTTCSISVRVMKKRQYVAHSLNGWRVERL